MKLDNWVISRLSEPFKPEELHWRVGASNMFMAYIDARQVVERLNYVVGAENWNDYYSPIEFTETQVRETTDLIKVKEEVEKRGLKIADVFWTSRSGDVTSLKNKSFATFDYNNLIYGGISCELTVLDVTKQDVGTPSMADQMKGAHSDALKRAAVKFGIGSYLYDLKNLKGGYAERGVVLEAPELPDWAVPAARGNPDDAIVALFEKAKNTKNIDALKLENLYSGISVMGNYNTLAPLVVKRHVYESLSELIRDAEGGAK
jgi:hypothetical protein